MHYTNSYKFGKAQESKVLPVIKDFFKRDIQAYPEEFSKYDFFDDTYNYELKSRTNNKKTYPTTMLTYNKITKDKPLILLFNFKDQICYIEYDETKFQKYEKQMFSRAGLSHDEKEHIFIPIKDLIDITEPSQKS
jgi:transposase-like protein